MEVAIEHWAAYGEGGISVEERSVGAKDVMLWAQEVRKQEAENGLGWVLLRL